MSKDVRVKLSVNFSWVASKRDTPLRFQSWRRKLGILIHIAAESSNTPLLTRMETIAVLFQTGRGLSWVGRWAGKVREGEGEGAFYIGGWGSWGFLGVLSLLKFWPSPLDQQKKSMPFHKRSPENVYWPSPSPLDTIHFWPVVYV